MRHKDIGIDKKGIFVIIVSVLFFTLAIIALLRD